MTQAGLRFGNELQWDGGGSTPAAAERRGADSTASLAATHGRSAYLAEETQRGVVDPGARAVAIAFAAVASA